MARAALKWSIDDLAERAAIGRATVARFELGENVEKSKVDAMKAQFAAKGIEFTGKGRGRYGVTYLGMEKTDQ
ncbi:MAG: XRE family transcriptional regulator [Erythrobacter sp.]